MPGYFSEYVRVLVHVLLQEIVSRYMYMDHSDKKAAVQPHESVETEVG